MSERRPIEIAEAGRREMARAARVTRLPTFGPRSDIVVTEAGAAALREYRRRFDVREVER